MLVHVCPDCRRELDPKNDGEYPLCPACLVPLREEFRPHEDIQPARELVSVLRVAV